MTIKEFFNNELKIKEAFELPDKLMKVLMNHEEKERLMDRYIQSGFKTDVSALSEYFQEQHSDRKSLMQDFTPESIIKLVKKIAPETNITADICAGVGGLSAGLKSEFIYCEELSNRAIPLLIFIMAIQNKEGVIMQGDSLKNNFGKSFRLSSTTKYSKIEIFHPVNYTADLIVSNPPYSITWDAKEIMYDSRFSNYPPAPQSKADYAFLIHALSKLEEKGTMIFIYPHGVLFRGQNEGKIRTRLIEENLIDAVIGLPEKMFTGTDIPTVMMILKKNRTNKDILFIDASKTCEEGKKNKFTDENIEKIIATYKHRLEVEKFSHLAYPEELEENDYNLNIPRYVDTFEPEEVPNLIETLKALIEIKEETKKTEKEFFMMFEDLTGTTEEAKNEIEQAKELARRLYET